MTDYKAIKLIKNGCEFCFSGGGEKYYELLVVAGGGGGGNGGGGAGGVIHRTTKLSDNNTYNVIVGKGGCKGACSYVYGCNGGDSSFGDIIAYGGGAGGPYSSGVCCGCNGGSGGGRGHNCCYTGSDSYIGKGCTVGLEAQGRNGGDGSTNCCYCYPFYGGSGGGATKEGGGMYSTNPATGIELDISGENVIYSGGGGGGSRGCSAEQILGGSCVGGNGAVYSSNCSANRCPATNPTTCGSGGGGGNPCGCNPTSGADGVVIIRYPTAMGDTSSGGCKYTCGDYTIHCFTSDGIFITDTSKKQIRYLAVGGGGGGDIGGGGGGEVKTGEIGFEDTLSLNITIGAGGSGGRYSADNATDGGDTCLGDIVAYGGKRATFTRCGGQTTYGCGGMSGSGCVGGQSKYCCNNICYTNGGGGGGAGGNGGGGYYCCGGAGGKGVLGYGGGGGGGACGGYSGCGKDGGGNGAYCYGNSATNYGGGGGGGPRCMGGNGCQGVVDICYPCDGSFGFSSATGGNCCYLCGDICVHRFTSNGTFTVVS